MGRHWLTPLCSFVGVAQLLHTKQWQTMFVLGLLHVLDLVHAQATEKNISPKPLSERKTMKRVLIGPGQSTAKHEFRDKNEPWLNTVEKVWQSNKIYIGIDTYSIQSGTQKPSRI